MTTKRDPLIVTMPDTRPAREERLKMLWEQMLSQNPANKDFIEVILTMKSFATAAYDELLKRAPSNTELRRCLLCKDGSVSVKAGKRILANDPTNNDLAQLVNWGDDNTSDKAWQELLRRNKQSAVANETLKEIITSSCHNVAEYRDKKKFRELAAKLLLVQSPGKSDLICIMEHCSEKLAGQAMEEFVGQNPTNEDLCNVLKRVRHGRIAIMAMGRLVYTRFLSNDALILIITTQVSLGDNAYEWRRQALVKLVLQNPTQEQLVELVKRVPKEFENQVWELFLYTNPSEEMLLSLMEINAVAEILRRPNPSRKALRKILEWSEEGFEEYKEKAARMLLENGANHGDLVLIEGNVSSLAAEARKRLPPKSVKEIIQQMRNIGA